jgi:uncharacterized protein YukE
MSAVGGNGAALHGALKDLNAYWERTSSSWRDAARDHFEAEYIRSLADAVRAASTAIGQIEVLLQQVRKECS